MKISTKGRYGLRVMLELASHSGQGALRVEQIARRQGISAKYIHVLVSSLRSAGLVNTVRGPNGGCTLARSPSAITALDVVAALEGASAPVECVLDAAGCKRSAECATREVWCEVAAAMDRVLAGLTLEQLARRQRDKEAGRAATSNYQI
ncbi:MAG TPA: Rrf2 family transcriptional regulator [Myxococcota bacterium]|nr:Rrf2 family transcriptional regulator [Myxococcota bacterium]HRY94523.1 Rrf2 family transcriptional regulator [Myxococcota bacterium]HSA20022.1 Rrf2 family transcriptional regulator [Myxococcota bacterium]